jgi:hypothetical protein
MIRDDLGSPEISANNDNKVTGKDTKGKEYPGFNTMLYTCLQ